MPSQATSTATEATMPITLLSFTTVFTSPSLQ
jgi:hypothetical protein